MIQRLLPNTTLATCLLVGLGLGLGASLTPRAAAQVSDAPPISPPISPYDVLDPVFTAGPMARLPVRIVAGRLVVTCDVSTTERRLPANLFLDFESPSTLELHNQAANGLKAERQDGSTIPITVHLPGLEFAVGRRQIGDDPYLDRFTRWHSIELGEVAVIGTIGGRVLKDFSVTFDLAAGELVLEPPRSKGSAPTGLPAGTESVAMDIRGGLVWLPARVGHGAKSRTGVFALGSGAYDSTIDWDLAASLGAPAGDIGPVRLGDSGSLDLAPRLALRPSEVPYSHPDGALGVLGLGFLEDFRVEIDRTNRRVYLSPTAPPEFPTDDLAFFEASWDDWGPRENPDTLEAWLETYCPVRTEDDKDEAPLPRLAPEAARALVELRLFEGASSEAVQRALEWADRSVPRDLRSTAALEMMDLAASIGAPEALVAAGELGVDGGRDDRYPDAVHKVHARMGSALIGLERGEEAWRHLLSAAFGMPNDGPVNLGLGRYYESQAEELAAAGDLSHAAGRYRRAFSRFLQAAIRPESGPAGVEALARVQAALQKMDAAGPSFSAELVERLIAGKVRNFGAPGKFEETPENSTGKTVLVEFFTNASYGTEERGGAIGGGLAQEGLQQFFNDDQVAFLSYHLPTPTLEPLVNDLGIDRAARLGITAPNLQVIDGVGAQPGAGKWRDGEAIYTRTKKAIEKALLVESDFFFDLEAEYVDGAVRGTLTVDGPGLDEDGEARCAVQLVLAERRVIFPGTSGIVIHRMVARAELTGELGGLPFEDGDFFELEFTADLAQIEADNEAALDRLVASGAGAVRKLSLALDPRELVLVAFVRDLASGEVLAAMAQAPDGIEPSREESP